MADVADGPRRTDVDALLEKLVLTDAVQSNCLFQLALMLARIALEPCSETYKAKAAQAVIDLIRAKPKDNVVGLFGSVTAAPRSASIGLAAR